MQQSNTLSSRKQRIQKSTRNYNKPGGKQMIETEHIIIIIGISGLYLCSYIIASTLDNILKELKEIKRLYKQ